MKSVPFGVLKHHALKAAVPLFIASILADDVRGKSPVFGIGSIVGYVVTIALMLFAWSHAKRADKCGRCAPKPPGRLNSLPRRAWRTYGGWGITPMFALVAVILILGTVMLDKKPPNRETEFNWGATLWLTSIVMAVMLHIGTVGFCRLNHPGLRIRRPLQSFIDRRERLRHNGHLIVTVAALTCIALAFFTHGGAWAAVQSTVMLILIISVYANHRHSMSLCERCAAEFRIDAPDYAETRKWAFMAIHRFGMVPLAVLLIAIGADPFLSDAYDPYFLAMNLGSSATLALLDRFHSSYQPWCPYCRNGGGGGGSHGEPVPDPSGGHGRPVPIA